MDTVQVLASKKQPMEYMRDNGTKELDAVRER
jgi:hypothetical protein